MPRKKAETKPAEAAAVVEETVKVEEAAAEAKPAKKSAAKAKTADKAKAADKKAEPVLTTIVQVGDVEFDISGIAEKAYKSYKSTHKRKAVTEFKIYVKPEESAAYYTVNGEGAADFKVDL